MGQVNNIYIKRTRGEKNPQLTVAGTLYCLGSNLDPELFSACRGESSRALGKPGARLSLIGFSKKTIKVFLIGPFKFARERLNVRRVWRVSGFFPKNVELNTTGRLATPAYS